MNPETEYINSNEDISTLLENIFEEKMAPEINLNFSKYSTGIFNDDEKIVIVSHFPKYFHTLLNKYFQNIKPFVWKCEKITIKLEDETCRKLFIKYDDDFEEKKIIIDTLNRKEIKDFEFKLGYKNIYHYSISKPLRFKKYSQEQITTWGRWLDKSEREKEQQDIILAARYSIKKDFEETFNL